MILVMDVGNTNIKVGLYKGENLLDSWRIATNLTRTADEYGAIFYDLLKMKAILFSDIKGVIISSVTPSINYTLEHMCNYYMNLKPIMVAPGIKTSLNIKYDNPKELGADRIVNAVAAYTIYKKSVIVVDFGTATTFSVVSKTGEFLGGCISPGIKVSMDAMASNAAKLPKIELIKPKTVIGKNTVSNMQSGFIYGFIGLVDYIIRKIKEELKDTDVMVVATGGLSQLIAGHENTIDYIDRTLTLKGLKMIYDLNEEDITK